VEGLNETWANDVAEDEDEDEDEDSAGEQENMAPQDNAAFAAEQDGGMELDKPVQMSQ